MNGPESVRGLHGSTDRAADGPLFDLPVVVESGPDRALREPGGVRSDSMPVRGSAGTGGGSTATQREPRSITLAVLGTPAPKGSSRAMTNKRTGRAILVPSGNDANRDRMKAWDTAIREAACAVAPQDGALAFVGVPLVFAAAFRLTRPRGHYNASGAVRASAPRYPITKPDGDKLARQAADTLALVLFDDDSRIVVWNISKIYASAGDEGATLTISEVTCAT